MIVKTHISPEGKKIVAVCDSDIIGKKFEDGKIQLDLCSDFYKGIEKQEKELDEIIKTAYILNVVGASSIGWAIKKGLISDNGIIKVEGIPHAQIVMIRD